jgi:hypothetical protein
MPKRFSTKDESKKKPSKDLSIVMKIQQQNSQTSKDTTIKQQFCKKVVSYLSILQDSENHQPENMYVRDTEGVFYRHVAQRYKTSTIPKLIITSDGLQCKEEDRYDVVYLDLTTDRKALTADELTRLYVLQLPASIIAIVFYSAVTEHKILDRDYYELYSHSERSCEHPEHFIVTKLFVQTSYVWSKIK